MARNISITVIPTQIQNLRTTSVTQTTIALAWDAYPGATAYQVYRSTTQGSLGTLLLTPTATPNPTFSNSGHTAGTTYYYTVRPVVGGSGVASAEASIVVMTAGAPATGFVAEAGYSVSGTVGDMLPLVIVGTGFGSKAGGGKPWLYMPHSTDVNPDATYSRGTSGALRHIGCAWSSVNPPANTSGSLSCLMSSQDNAAGWSLPTATDIYTFAHRRFGYDTLHDAIGTNHKYWRCWTDIDGPNPPRANGFGAFTSGWPTAVTPILSYDPLNSGPNTKYFSATPISDAINTQWHTFEHEISPSSQSVANGTMTGWLNGSRFMHTTQLVTWDATWNVPTWKQVFFSQCSGDTEPGYFYYGPTLIEDSRCRVIVSTESTWNTSTSVSAVRDFCLPTAWSDNQITVTIRKGIHTTLSGKYLWVVTNSGTAIKVGSFT